MSVDLSTCELCREDGGELIHQAERFRVILVDDAAFPGFCRVVWNDHVREMTDLDASDRSLLMNAVWAVEAAVREVMAPHKVNLASLGNMVAHMHWHVIPRYTDDSHFPSPVWAGAVRGAVAEQLARRVALLPALRLALGHHLAALA